MSHLLLKIPLIMRRYIYAFLLIGFLASNSTLYFFGGEKSIDLSMLDKAIPTLGDNINGLYQRGYEHRIQPIRMVYAIQLLLGLSFIVFCLINFKKLYAEFLRTITQQLDSLKDNHGYTLPFLSMINIPFYFLMCICGPAYLNVIQFDSGSGIRFSNRSHLSDVSLVIYSSFMILPFSGFVGTILTILCVFKIKRS